MLGRVLFNINDEIQQSLTEFKSFCQLMARTDKTWKFWVQLTFQDAMAYVTLFLAIRSGNWTLRVASIKSMATLYKAYDHPNYQKLIAQHLYNLKQWPDTLLSMFQHGAFVVSISGRPWHSVGADEHMRC